MSYTRFVGERAVVTGAASGIGHATALRLCAEGAEVLAVDRDEARLAAAFERTTGITCHAADVAASRAIDAIADDLGEFDLLVNAAGVLRRHPLLDHPLSDWEATLDVNVRAVFRLCREFARAHLAAGTSASIVNVCSIESFTAAPAHVAYTVSKTAVLMLTRAFALELAPHGIRVNGVAPGVTETAMNAELRADPDRAGQLTGAIPLARFARPEEQAAAICFLASSEASYITGSVLPVDGGWLTQ
jgi:2-dehydro-3-deoxy-D-gluconate 5-dehydrogenase